MHIPAGCVPEPRRGEEKKRIQSSVERRGEKNRKITVRGGGKRIRGLQEKDLRTGKKKKVAGCAKGRGDSDKTRKRTGVRKNLRDRAKFRR